MTKLLAANEFKVDHINKPLGKAIVEKAKFIYATGFFVTVSPDSLRLLAHEAAEKNKFFMMNISAPFICQVPPFFQVLKELLPYIDILFGNETEAAALGTAMGWGTDLHEIGAQLVKYDKVNKSRSRMVVFTQGAQPALVFSGDSVTEYPVVPIEKAKIVDTNGAGDSFLGGFFSRFVLDRPFDECMAAAAYSAWVIIQQSGIFALFPAFTELVRSSLHTRC